MLKTFDISGGYARASGKGWVVPREALGQVSSPASATLREAGGGESLKASYVNYAGWENAGAVETAWQGLNIFASALSVADLKDAMSRTGEAGAQRAFLAAAPVLAADRQAEAMSASSPSVDADHRDVRHFQSTKDRYGPVAVALHWICALLILLEVPLGFAIQNVGDGPRLPIFLSHAVIGVGAGVLTVVRLAWWTLADRKPDAMPGSSKPERMLTKAVHGFFYFALLFLSVGGVMISIAKVLGPTLVALQPDIAPYLQIPVPAHNIAARLFMTLLGLHIAAALYHHWVRRDGTLKRMAPHAPVFRERNDRQPAFGNAVAA